MTFEGDYLSRLCDFTVDGSCASAYTSLLETLGPGRQGALEMSVTVQRRACDCSTRQAPTGVDHGFSGNELTTG
ncbi:MAG: hypothetical protein IIB00_02175 [candidate division Zixibacteria bacterium]|nr:hypothetical protein [candidate division Zixibacteria bacterium]